MKRKIITIVMTCLVLCLCQVHAALIQGKVTDASGKVMEGVMVSAFDDERRQSTSVFSQADGTFRIDGLREVNFKVRARLMGQLDHWSDAVSPDAGSLSISMKPATGEKLEEQRPATSGFSMLKFDNLRDKLNFKMMCSYCHQIGTIGFRSPEKPVDWETMIRRMDGFGGLYHHTQKNIIGRIIDTYKGDAVDDWPQFVPPPAPTGIATKAKITSWQVGKQYEGSFHDLELGPDGLVYAVNISKGRLVTLNPETGEQKFRKFPRGSHGPHSIELANDGNMWVTMCASGQMAKYDLRTKEFLVCSSAEAPARRGSYPHTLRINPKDPEGLIWYTDAGRNSCFSLHPETLKVKEYKLLEANQAKAAGKGESRGITPYGLDYSPVDGMIWYSKLNGNRIGRIDPAAPDGDIKEWNPPFRGPRRLHVAPDGIVWVPGFASGVFGRFDPKSEKWLVYDLPDAENQIPYALNVAPDGHVWICGTGNDTLYRFNPKTEYLVEFLLPHRVSYTREIEFDEEGNVWTSTSGPARHMETGNGSVIKLEVLAEADHGGQRLVGYVPDKSTLTYEQPRKVNYTGPNGKLLASIDSHGLPAAYESGQRHQVYVDKRMAGLTEKQRNRIGQLYAEKRKADPDMPNAGHSFVKIMEYVANEGQAEKTVAASPENQAGVHRLKSKKRSLFDAFVYVNRIPEEAEEGEPAQDFSGRIFGRLANQEGRIQIKLPPGMDRGAYLGFKAFLKSEPAAWRDANRLGSNERKAKIQKVIQDKIASSKANGPGKARSLGKADIENLRAFLGSLTDVTDEEFRRSIIDAEVLDTSIDIALPSLKNIDAEHPDDPKDLAEQSRKKPSASPNSALLARIEKNKVPADYPGGGDGHQPWVDRKMAGMHAKQQVLLGRLWAEKQRIDPDMKNRGNSFVKILNHVLREGMPEAGHGVQPKPKPGPVVVPQEKPKGPALSGTVWFEGKRPKRVPVRMYPESLALHDSVPLDEKLLISDGGGIANVFVYVKKGLADKDYPVPEKPAIIDQQGSIFRPRVQGIRIGQEVLMKNGDPFIHNIRSLSFKNRAFNIAQPANSPDRKKVFTKKEGPITIKCDFHPWMMAHFFVMDHPFFAVTNARGAFRIPGLPDGQYTIVAWHEELGEQEKKVTVSGGAAAARFSFKARAQ